MTSFTPRHDALLDHRAFLRNLASRLLSDPDDIEDVEQSTWLSSLTQAGPIAHPRSWLARVFRNHAADLRRRRRRVQRRESAAARDERLDDTTLVVERLEIGRRLVDAVMRLPVPQRDAILLCYYEELSQRAAAARLGITHQALLRRLEKWPELRQAGSPPSQS